MKTYALLGKNISYSLSPVMHNTAFRAMAIEAEYKIFDLPENEVDNFFSRLKTGEISGCNVTVPYKEKALEFLEKCEGPAGNIGAVNTVARRDMKLYGYNTDYEGFVESLTGRDTGDLNFNPKGKEVFIFGAGGAARAVIYSLMTLGAKRIAIADMDQKKAENLASAVSARYEGDSLITVVNDETKYDEFISKSELLINATPCGMKKDDPGLFDYKYIHEDLFVFDLIYMHETPLVKEAKSRGAGGINGVNMLLYQAAKSFAIWVGKNAPLEVMRKVLLERIAK